ncbi:MAG TPA: LamG domain-containing protein [Cytophagales bacterium]|nr:LamG domain-containing protein [Cytophagales bacterium]
MIKFNFLAIVFILTFCSCNNNDDDTEILKNKWLFLPNTSNECANFIEVGDLDVAGDELTIEAKFIKITDGNYCTPTKYPNTYDVISKHYNQSNVNYLLRSNYAQITTTDGFYTTNKTAIEIDHNKSYHIAMVYGGGYLKFYLDGLVRDSVAATGQIITNDLHARIGQWAGDYLDDRSTQFFGYIDELRIWNVARSKSSLMASISSSIKNPQEEEGLVAYYTFEEGYKNIQGNSLYDGITGGEPVIKYSETSVE